MKEKGRKVVATNRKARHNYTILDTYEAGIALVGTEVKSLREGKVSLVDAFATVDNGEVWLRGLHIPEFSHGGWTNHSPRRTRKLLLHKRGNRASGRQVARKANQTLIPLSMYFSDGKGKGRACPSRRVNRTTTNARIWRGRTAEREVTRELGRRVKGMG